MDEGNRLVVNGERHRALDFVLQLTRVARPLEPHQRVERVGIDPADALGVAPRARREKAGCEQRDILAAIAQRRQLNREHREPVVKILAKAPGRDYTL
jgi:hypothetical protein